MVQYDLETIMDIDKVMIQKLKKADHPMSAFRKQRKSKEWCWIMKVQGHFGLSR